MREGGNPYIDAEFDRSPGVKSRDARKESVRRV